MVFSEIEPFGSEANFYGHAITASTVANVHRRKNTEAYEASDFMPKPKPKKQQAVDAMIGIAAHITQALGGKDKRK